MVECFLHPGHGSSPSAGRDQVGSLGGQQGPSLLRSADTRQLGEQEHRADLISLWYLAVPTPLPVLPVHCFPPFLS